LRKTKFIAVTGGVLSGVGKGTITASIGALLKFQGYSVTAIKIDPYINVDAGTLRPTEHGEVFVTVDGGETDQDLGTYERFLDITLKKDHSITTGQVYLNVINKERNLEFDGKTVEVIPHIPQEVKHRIFKVADDTQADFVLVEVGGTVGDYQSVLFLEALREMRLEGDQVFFAHVVYMPVPGNLGEMKTKPAQHSVRELNSVGIQPDMIVCRGQSRLDDIRREKLSMFSNVSKDFVFSAPDVKYVFEVPMMLEQEGLTRKILSKFNMKYKKPNGQYKEWANFVEKIKNLKKEVKVGIVGKYFDSGDFALEDSYMSVIESVKYASWSNNAKPVIEWINSKNFEKNPKKLKDLSKYNGIIVPGGFGGSGVEGKIAAIKFCRENNIPYLGLCYGMQLAVVEFARNVCGMKDASTTETNPKTSYPVIDILPEQVENIKNARYGATMRLGSYDAVLKKGSQVQKLYGKDKVSERHRHRYEVNPKYIAQIEAKGLIFSGTSPSRKLMEFMELPKNRFHIGTQAHPEFQSRFLKPAPLFNGFIKACLK
jgi:CTP synthase